MEGRARKEIMGLIDSKTFPSIVNLNAAEPDGLVDKRQ